ncbi:MAG TPA: WD40 repeat domain-containing protein [Nonomuraea sp.]|nr:WD40 repeat domain-containing protein [Nonomuraea sp.]
MASDLTSLRALLDEDGPALLRGALGGSWPPALLRAVRRAFPWLLALPGPERVEFLRATAAAEEPAALAALAALAAAEPGAWAVAWEAGERPTAFHVRLARHDGPVRAVAVGEFAGRTFVASGGDDRVVRLRDASDQSGPDLRGPRTSIRSLAFGVADGRPVLACGDAGGTIRTWDPLTAARGFTRRTSPGHPAALAFVPARGGRPLLAVAIGHDDVRAGWSHEGRVDLLDPVTGELVRTLRADQGNAMLDLAVAEPAGRAVLAALSAHRLYVWDVATGERLGTAEPSRDESGPWLSGGFAPPLLVSASGGRPEIGVVVVQLDQRDFEEETRRVTYLEPADLGHQTRAQEFDLHQGPVTMTTRPGGDVMLVANRTDLRVAWEPPAGAHIMHLSRGADIDLDADTHLITAAAFGDLRGRLHLATAGLDGTVQLWDAQTPHEHRRTGHGGSGLALFTSAQGAPVLAAGTRSGTVLLLDAAGGASLGTVGCGQSGDNHDCEPEPYDHCCQALAAGDVSGRPYLATSGCADGTMLWQPLTATPGVPRENGTAGLPTFGRVGQAPPTALAFGEAGGRTLLAAGVEVWDPASRERVAVLPEWFGFRMSESVFGRAADQPVLATRRENAVSLWNPLTGDRLHALDVDDTGAGLAMGRVAARDVLAVGSGTSVHLVDAAGERREQVPHASTVTCLCLVEHGDRLLLVTGTEDGVVALWDVASRRRLAVLGAFARPVRSVAATVIRGSLHVYGQSCYGRILAWRADIP